MADQATLDFQHNVVSLHDGLVAVNFNHIEQDLSNILITDEYCTMPPRTEQVINVRPSSAIREVRLLLKEALAYHDRKKYLVARSISKTNKGKCACKDFNTNNETFHIKKNTIVETLIF